jgi:NAD(P)-dependent dehydrogenase (short-subunit alcohol dehydrogenase family)|tara:strand:+ start:527 stop:1426 length:900 start_codon:yes stop_codon:yes gene_type:complete
MSELEGKVAVVSGGAEGIGLCIALSMAKQGMKVVISDIDANQLEIARQALEDQGAEVLAIEMDVVKIEDWQSLAEQTLAKFGKIHMLVNNAGVGASAGSIEKTNHKDWQWVLDVNLMGVIYGTQTLVPYMKQHGEGGWLINVASMAGMGGVPFAGAYTATKVAVVGMSESWHPELKPHNIQVSVLCPAFVKTRINLSHRNKQDEYKNPPSDSSSSAGPSPKALAMAEHMQKVIDDGLAPEIVGERVVEAILAKELYIFTHPNYREGVQKRSKAIDDAFARAEKSPLLAHMLDEEVVGFS